MESLNCLTDECINLLNRNKLLETLIGEEIIRKVLSEVKLDIETENNLINELMGKLKLPNEDSLEKYCIEKGITKDFFIEVAVKETKHKILCKRKFDLKEESHFLKRKNQLDIAVYSIIRTKSFYKARELYLRIAEGEEDFSQIAANFSEGPEKNTLGRVGPIVVGQSHPKLAEHIRNSKPGDIQSPVEIDNYLIILRVETYTPAVLNDSMRLKMREELFNEWLKASATEIKNELLNRKNSNTKVT